MIVASFHACSAVSSEETEYVDYAREVLKKEASCIYGSVPWMEKRDRYSFSNARVCGAHDDAFGSFVPLLHHTLEYSLQYKF